MKEKLEKFVVAFCVFGPCLLAYYVVNKFGWRYTDVLGWVSEPASGVQSFVMYTTFFSIISIALLTLFTAMSTSFARMYKRSLRKYFKAIRH